MRSPFPLHRQLDQALEIIIISFGRKVPPLCIKQGAKYHLPGVGNKFAFQFRYVFSRPFGPGSFPFSGSGIQNFEVVDFDHG